MRAQATTQDDVGLGNVDNTSDLDKPISTDTQDALNNKADDGDPQPAQSQTTCPTSANTSGGHILVIRNESEACETKFDGYIYYELEEGE